MVDAPEGGRSSRAEAQGGLSRLAEALQPGQALDPAAVQRILEERARRLAQPPPPPPPTDLVAMVIFEVAHERFGIDARAVEGVFRLVDRAVLPGAPAPIAGVTSHRGELLTLVDLRSDLGLRPGALDDLGRVLVLQQGNHRAGVLVDRVEGLLDVRMSELTPLPDGRAGGRNLIRGVTPDVVAVLDSDAILRFFDEGDDS